MPYEKLEKRLKLISWARGILPNFLKKHIDKHHTRREDTKEFYTDALREIGRFKVGLEEEISTAKRTGESLPDGKRYFELVLQSLDQLKKLKKRSRKKYLKSEEITKVSKLDEIIKAHKKYLEVKVEYDRLLGEIIPQATIIQDNLKPYINYKDYLIFKEKEYLEQKIEKFILRLLKVKSNLKFSILSEAERDRLIRMIKRFEQFNKFLPNYNDRYVEREIEKNKNFLSPKMGLN